VRVRWSSTFLLLPLLAMRRPGAFFDDLDTRFERNANVAASIDQSLSGVPSGNYQRKGRADARARLVTI
jgi:hypothetical protein